MVFSSMFFLWVFLPIVFIGSRILKGKYVNLFLLCASLFFYGWGEPKYIFLMLISICINYVIAIYIHKAQEDEKNIYARILLIVALLVNLGILVYFKYFNFIIDNINLICKNQVIAERNIILPIGISFYTFQILSYVIDVYLKKVRIEKSIINLGLYISFFPQLIAGPIVKFTDIQNQIENRDINSGKTFEGIRRFVIGLSKKVLIANTCAYTADLIFSKEYGTMGALTGWLGIICYTFQIYYDFSGYSDMAIGLGKIMGFEFLENFNYPYISKSIQEFWRRWHISLSTWFKEYLYIPLGGNRKGKIRTYINLLIVFFCTGFWHGASWNFVLWGMWNGLFLVLERMFLGKILEKNKFKLINHIYSIFVVMFGWVLFRANNLTNAVLYLKNLLIWDSIAVEYNKLTAYLNPQLILVLVGAVIFAGIFRYKDIEIKASVMSKKRFCVETVFIYVMMFANLLALVSSTYNPFIYFRF